MGYYIMQASPGEDFYIQFSTVMDLPMRLGSMEEWKNLLNTMSGNELASYQFMMDRMLECGTSSMSGNGAWDNDIILSSQGHPAGAEYWSLPRDSVSEFFGEYQRNMDDRIFWHHILEMYASPL